MHMVQILIYRKVENYFNFTAGCYETDGAIWSKGFSTGKHVFEVVFPKKARRPYGSIGIGTKHTELHLQKATTLVGKSKYSWGVDLSSKKVFSNGLLVGKFPDAIFTKLPDRFFMYIDLVSCRLMFGSDGKYYGVAIEDETMKHFTVYPMVSSAKEGAAITMVYRGIGTLLKPYNVIYVSFLMIRHIRRFSSLLFFSVSLHTFEMSL